MQPHARRLARFALDARLEAPAREALKLRMLDAMGCAIGALQADPVEKVRRYVAVMGGAERCSLIGDARRSSPPLAALYNGFLVRYLDYNDSYLAPRETCHPSDNLAPVLAAAEDADADGETLLTALAVAYQVQCRLSDVAPVRNRGFDHTVQGAFAVAAGCARALGLSLEQACNAIAIAGTAFHALRVTRTGRLSHWKGLAYPNLAFASLHATYLAKEGITGPELVFEGNKGFMQSIAGPFELDWEREHLERVTRTSVKRFNAEIHSQSVLEALAELRRDAALAASDIERIEVYTFDVARNIIGGGEEGDKTVVETKEQADHSLPYLCAVLWLDGAVGPRQFEASRIQARDVQELLRRVQVFEEPAFSRLFPEQMPCRVRVIDRAGTIHEKEKRSYRGYYDQPVTWTEALAKFNELTPALSGRQRDALCDVLARLERQRAADLARLLARGLEPG
jgi:2-methylcitrate dehydratase